jgi:hypothetical protein
MPDHQTVGVPPRTKLHRIIRGAAWWIVWTDTTDFIHGTYLVLNDNGRVDRVTERTDASFDTMMVRPPDKEIV